MTCNHVGKTAMAASLAIAAAAGCAARQGPDNDPGARVVGGRLRPAVTRGEMGPTARRALHGAAVGGGGGAAIAHRMDVQAEDLANDLRFARVWRVGEGIAVVLDSGLLFDSESSALVSDVHDGLQGLVRSLHAETRTRILVLGHTDSFAGDSYNQALSERRAGSVENEMMRLGLNANNIQIVGRSFTDPLVPTGPGVREPQNRRAVIDLGQ